MKPNVHADRPSRWIQALALLLGVAIGLQGVPLQLIVQHVQHTTPHHECAHPDGVCPMNPDGPCSCDHDDTAPPSTDGPVLEGCGEDSPTALRAPVYTKWVGASDLQPPKPRSHPLSRTPRRSLLSSQRTGDDVFHPPRLPAHRQPARTPQAVHSA